MNIKRISLLTFIIVLVFVATITVKAANEGFKVTRTVTGATNPVTNTFTYTVTNESGNPATITIPGTTTIAFNAATPSSNTATQSANPLIAEGAWTGAENWPGTSTKLSYTIPGTYKFKVAETGSTNATLYQKDTNYYIVTVWSNVIFFKHRLNICQSLNFIVQIIGTCIPLRVFLDTAGNGQLAQIFHTAKSNFYGCFVFVIKTCNKIRKIFYTQSRP